MKIKFWGKQAICVILAALFVSFFPLCCRADGNTEAVDNACKGVVRVIADFGNYISSGSAFGVGKAGQMTDIFVTNWHVVTDQEHPDANGKAPVADKVYILLSNDAVVYDSQGYISMDNSKMIECEVLYITEGYPDVAILKAARPVEDHIALPLMYAEDAKRGDEIFTLGFPGTNDGSNSGYYYAEIEDMDVDNGVISKFFKFENAGSTMAIQHHAHINHGNSGGPLITEDGAVIGINTYGYGEGMEYSVSIYVDYAMVGLDELGIDYDLYDPDAADEPDSNETEKPDSNGTEEPDSNGTEKPGTHESEKPDKRDEPDDKWFPIFLVSVAAAILAITAAVLVNRRKRGRGPSAGQYEKQNVSAPQVLPSSPVQPASQPAAGSIRLQGISGEFAGRRFAVNSVIRIGRDPLKNDLVYPDGCRGISGVHCELHVRGGQVFLRDVGSTNGTFLHGKRIPNNQMIPVNMEETFYLGTSRESFKITQKIVK